ncbi:MAG: hypothetical protein A2017_07795 [Lentisphaerae bacterium GWF2_44_16]|nr:MAG: hypothetical protein A2017_07795 [Lentisphaerae bacterium GWF2_44_16]
MKKNSKFLLTVFSAFILTGGSVPALFSKNPESSDTRFKKICGIIQKIRSSGVNIADPEVKKAILKELSKDFVLEPKEKPDTRSVQELADEARAIIAKKYPETTKQIIKKAQAVAEKKFAMHNVMDNVSVRFQQGTKTYSVDGIFYTYGGNSIKVGEQFIPIFDLLPDSRVKFDKVYNQQRKKEFIDNMFSGYLSEKSARLTEIYKELKEKQLKRNEELGYIFVYKEWRSPGKVAEIYMSSIVDADDIKKLAEAKAPEQKIAAAQAPAEDAPAAKIAENTPETAPAAKTTEPAKSPYEELKQKIDKRILEISNTCAGIDADQGYKMALWGMTKDEIEMLLSTENSFSSGDKSSSPGEDEYSKKITPDSIILEYSKGPISKVVLYFVSGLFYKVEINFRLVSNTAMQRLTSLFNERYGLTDEQKKLKEEMEKNRKEVDVDAAEQTGEVVSEDEHKKNAVQIPLEQAFHWTGKVTLGTVIIKINTERTAYTEFSLIKENPRIKEEAKSLMIKENQRIKEERRRKELEEYNKKKIEF